MEEAATQNNTSQASSRAAAASYWCRSVRGIPQPEREDCGVWGVLLLLLPVVGPPGDGRGVVGPCAMAGEEKNCGRSLSFLAHRPPGG
jgi:hypothetical protein